MHRHDPTVVLVPIESTLVNDLDRYADRVIAAVDAIPHENPLSKAEQNAWLLARTWKDSPHRRGLAPTMKKAA